jgi:hypothetical protein
VSELPILTVEKIDILEPRRATARMERVDPQDVKSSVEQVEPISAAEKIDMVDPNLFEPRRERVLPSVMKS